MAVKIRLARFGKTNAPFYNIVVANARYSSFRRTAPSLPDRCTDPSYRTARNSKPIEVLGQSFSYVRLSQDRHLTSFVGTYDPIPKSPPHGQGKPFKDIKLDTARAKYWLGVGAQPSDPVWRLLAMVSHRTAFSISPMVYVIHDPRPRILIGLEGWVDRPKI